MLLFSYVAGITGVSGKQVRYSNVQTVEQAVRIALSVQEAEKQEIFNNSFYSRFEYSASLQSRTPSRKYGESERPRHSGATCTPNQMGSQRPAVPRSENKTTASSTRNTQTKDNLRC